MGLRPHLTCHKKGGGIQLYNKRVILIHQTSASLQDSNTISSRFDYYIILPFLIQLTGAI